jgi:uncharacterized protein (TIGR04255 family)
MAKTTRKKSPLPDYTRPPVIEVVYGVKFTPLTGWKLPHIGAFWQRVVNEFPHCEHAQPVDGPEIMDPITGFPMLRVWLINSADDRLIQLQPGRFLFNWRSRPDKGAYPHYAELSQKFFTYFHQFCEFVAEHDLGDIEALEFELTYINHVFEQEGWIFPEKLGRVINQLEWQDKRFRFLPRPSAVNWQVKFPFSKQHGNLSVKLNPAKGTNNDKQFLALELSARGLPDKVPMDHMESWFSHAHEWIVRGFEDLTSDDAQKELWGKHE